MIETVFLGTGLQLVIKVFQYFIKCIYLRTEDLIRLIKFNTVTVRTITDGFFFLSIYFTLWALAATVAASEPGTEQQNHHHARYKCTILKPL